MDPTLVRNKVLLVHLKNNLILLLCRYDGISRVVSKITLGSFERIQHGRIAQQHLFSFCLGGSLLFLAHILIVAKHHFGHVQSIGRKLLALLFRDWSTSERNLVTVFIFRSPRDTG